MKRPQGGGGVDKLAMLERCWSEVPDVLLFAQPHVMPKRQDEAIVRAGVKEGDLGPEIRLRRQQGRDNGEKDSSTEGLGTSRHM